MGVCHSASGNAFETCAGAVVGREWPSCGEGVVRASAVSELTERVKFFFLCNHDPRASHYQYQAQTFFRPRPRGQEVLSQTPGCAWYLRSMYTMISVSVAPLAGRRHFCWLEQRGNR